MAGGGGGGSDVDQWSTEGRRFLTLGYGCRRYIYEAKGSAEPMAEGHKFEKSAILFEKIEY